MTFDVVIIGGGLGGLECANILSRCGMSVVVLEQGAQAGGCLQSYRRMGMTFDTGFHYVGGLDEGQSLHAAFRLLGLLDLPWQRLDAEGFDQVTIGGRTFSFAQGFDNFSRKLAEDFPSERAALQSYARLLQDTSREQLDALNPKADPDDTAYDAWGKSAWRYLTETFHDPLLINVLSGTSLKMELRKESLPLFTFLHSNSSYVESSWRLCGGGGKIVERLVSNLRREGGEIVCNARVTELTEKNGQIVRAVCQNGDAYEGKIFICDNHPATAIGLVKGGSGLRPSFRRRITSTANTTGMFTVSLRVKPRFARYFNFNHFVYDCPDVWEIPADGSAIGGMMISCRKDEKENGFTQQIDLLTPMRWETCEQWLGSAPLRRAGTYKQMKKQMADKCTDLAERYFPGIRKASQAYTSTPLTWHDYTLTPEGSAYGLRKDFHFPLQAMLSPRTPIPNLLLTGQSLMLHGVHGVTMTSLLTCAEVVGKEKVWKILIKE